MQMNETRASERNQAASARRPDYRPRFTPVAHPPQHPPLRLDRDFSNERFLQEAKALFPTLQALRRHFHQYPELAMEERETARHICQTLKQWGISHRIVAPYGVVAEIQGRAAGKTVALRADMDALPLQELAEPAYKSLSDGCMHACGHDAHMAMLLGAAKLLSAHRDSFSGTVKLLFQEGEEIGVGALQMLEAGVLQDCSAIFGLHQSASYPTGQILVREKHFSAANVIFTVKLKGKGSHGSMPHQSVDPVLAAAALVQALQQIVSRELDPSESAVLSVGYIKSDTCRCNIIPEQTEIGGTIRYYHSHLAQTIEAAFRRMVEAVAKAYRVEPDIFYVNACVPVYNDPALTKLAAASAGGLSPDIHVTDQIQTAAAEDYAFYQQRLPGVFLFIGSGSEAHCQPLHSPYYDINESSLSIGCALYAKLAVDYLNTP